MEKRRLGISKIEIAPLVFGGNVFGWTIDEAKSFELLDMFTGHGLNMVDTADVYSAWANGNKGGESETIIGKWFKYSGKRDQVILGTKVGMEMGDGSKGLSKEHIIKSVEGSLKRLQTDYIDVYYSHQDDQSTPLSETLEAHAQLIKDGKVRAIASSNYKAERLEEAIKFSTQNDLPQYIAHQPEYNLFDRAGYEGALENLCEKYKLGVVTYFSLASGFLSGKYRTEDDLKNSNRGADFLKKYMTERGLRILKALDEVAENNNSTQVATALAWIIHRPTITAPIASATTMHQLEQLIAAVNLKLSDEDMKTLNDASDYND